MQILMSVAFILLTLSIPRPDEATMAAGTTPISMFSITLMLFIITALPLPHTTLPPTASTCWH